MVGWETIYQTVAIAQVRFGGYLTLGMAGEAGEEWEELGLIGGVESVGCAVWMSVGGEEDGLADYMLGFWFFKGSINSCLFLLFQKDKQN